MANKIITDTYYGGSNQIARLPYETIDALQQIGLYLAPTDPHDPVSLVLGSRMQDLSDEKSVDLGLNISNYSVNTNQLNVSDTLTLKGSNDEVHNILYMFPQIINVDVNIGGVGAKLTQEQLNMIKNIDKPYILIGNDQSVILMTDPVSKKGIYVKANSKIMQWAEINPLTGGITITSSAKNQYVHMMKIVSTAGDTCYLTAISPMAKRASTNYLTVKLYIIGGLSTAEGTSVGTVTGEYACSGYNSTTNKTIVALNLGENKFVYSDGTKSTEALSSSNTTVTGDVFGQSI